jgi:hypothetical protein
MTTREYTQCYTQAAAARLLGVSRERVRQQLARHPTWIADHQGPRGAARINARGLYEWERAGVKRGYVAAMRPACARAARAVS